MEDLRWGTGEEAKPHDTVTIHYRGTFAVNGKTFDSSYDRNEPATFPLDRLIKGWQEGIPGMKVGSRRRLIVPPTSVTARKMSSKATPSSPAAPCSSSTSNSSPQSGKQSQVANRELQVGSAASGNCNRRFCDLAISRSHDFATSRLRDFTTSRPHDFALFKL